MGHFFFEISRGSGIPFKNILKSGFFFKSLLARRILGSVARRGEYGGVNMRPDLMHAIQGSNKYDPLIAHFSLGTNIPPLLFYWHEPTKEGVDVSRFPGMILRGLF